MESDSHLLTLHARIHGRVQGVWYRGWTVQQATALHLTGWVRNREDGTVEAVFHGDREKVDFMIRACHDGPEHANVNHVETTPAENEGWAAFTKEPTL